jgi:Winged helix DNA-binding domain
LNAYYNRQQKLDTKLLKKSNDLIAKALEGGTHLTRLELAAVLRRGGIRASGGRLAYIMMRAELDAIVCSGALKGKQHTYALLDERAPRPKALEPEAALAQFTRRYFTSRGPATLNDFLRWSSLTAAQGREGLALVEKELESAVIEGKTYWLGSSAHAKTSTTPTVDLVQGYDEIIMSYTESREESFRVKGAPFINAVLLDGRLVGHWKPTPQRNSLVIKTVLNRTLNRAEKQALAAAVGLTTAWMSGK